MCYIKDLINEDISFKNLKKLSFLDKKVEMLTYKELIELLSLTRNLDYNSLYYMLNNLGIKKETQITKEKFAIIIANLLTDNNIPTTNNFILNTFSDKDEIDINSKKALSYCILRTIYPFEVNSKLNPKGPISYKILLYSLKHLTYKVVDILCTNDLHGQIEGDFKKNLGMAYLSSAIKERRNTNYNSTIVVDAGDSWQGSILSNHSQGEIMLSIMDEIQYDAIALGNHDFDFGKKKLISNIQRSTNKFICSNIYTNKYNKRADWIDSYTIINKGGIRVGIIGVLTPETKFTTKSKNIEGLNIKDPISIVNKYLQKDELKNCELVIVVSHQGIKLNSSYNSPEGELIELAKSFKNSNVKSLIGGHVHQIYTKSINNLPVIISGSMSNNLGHIQLFLDRKTFEVKDHQLCVLDLKKESLEEDIKVLDIIRHSKTYISESMEEVVTHIEEPIYGHSYRYEMNGKVPRDGVNPLGNLISDAVREYEKADISLINVGIIRAELEMKGDVKFKDLYNVIPLGNQNKIGILDAKKIKEILEVTDKYSGLLATQYSGIKVFWDSKKPIGEKISSIKLLNGEPLFDKGQFSNCKYKVVTTDFMSTGGDGYSTLTEIEEWKSGEDMLKAWSEIIKNNHFNILKDPGNNRDFRMDINIKDV